ncbi:hypothetical protein ACFW31_19185 [Nocardiopsis alba]|uniref:hypothetical protein n=1 Tax=Nocardiopsis alba TaxID=53437 RepID=UPI003672E703
MQLHALVALALNTGLREAELATLDEDDVIITARTGRVRVVGKGIRGRTFRCRCAPGRCLAVEP